MCFRPTKEEAELSDAHRVLEPSDVSRAAANEGPRRDPWRYPVPRGNQELDDGAVGRSRDKLEAVLGH